MKYIKYYENIKNENFLFHSTNIKNLNDIEQYGLLPTFGDTVKNAYGGYYKLDGEDDDEDLAELKFEGFIFFADTPHLGYSQNMHPRNFKWEEAVLCIVEKNDTIFRKIDDYPKFIDYEGNPVYSYDGISFMDDLPIIVETGDWFTFEEQGVERILVGKELYLYMEKYYPKECEELNKISRFKDIIH